MMNAKYRTCVTIDCEIELPQLPNFLKVLTAGAKDGSVAQAAQMVSIADLGERDLHAIGEKWTEALKVHAKEIRERRKNVAAP